jgi:hypothetical protein
MARAISPETCQACPRHGTYTHSVREHDVAQDWTPALVIHIKTDAFASMDRPLSYKEAIEKFDLDVPLRRAGRVLDAVEWILRGEGWPADACGGVAAYVVNASSREPGEGWKAVWDRDPRAARAVARAFVREQALSD